MANEKIIRTDKGKIVKTIQGPHFDPLYRRWFFRGHRWLGEKRGWHPNFGRFTCLEWREVDAPDGAPTGPRGLPSGTIVSAMAA